MPFVAPKASPPSTFPAVLGPARGKVNDFWALAYCHEVDELEQRSNPDHETFTFILRYENTIPSIVARVPWRLDALYLQQDGTLLVAGDTKGYMQLTPTGLAEVPLPGIPGAFSCLWGVSDQHLFATGYAAPFALYRRFGTWQTLALPPDVADLQAVGGFAEDDVYFVGKHGEVLHFDGRAIQRVQAPVRTWWLTSIACPDPQQVFIGGYGGTLLFRKQHRWRYVSTQTRDNLLAVGAFQGEVFYGAEQRVYATDGIAPPRVAMDYAAAWISELDDGLVLGGYVDAKLYGSGGLLVDLDVNVS